MSDAIRIRVDTKKWERTLEALGNKNAARAGFRAVNRTMTSARSTVVKLVSSDMGLQQKRVRDKYITVVLQKDKGQAPGGALYATTARVPLIDFKAKGPTPSRGRGRGVTARLPTGAGRYPTAFIATMKSGHTGVFQRVGTSARRSAGARANNLPIAQLHGPSTYQAFQKHAPEAERRALEVLDKNWQHEVDYLISQASRA